MCFTASSAQLLPQCKRSCRRRPATQPFGRSFGFWKRRATQDAVVALLDTADQKLSKRQLDELTKRIAAARKEGR